MKLSSMIFELDITKSTFSNLKGTQPYQNVYGFGVLHSSNVAIYLCSPMKLS